MWCVYTYTYMCEGVCIGVCVCVHNYGGGWMRMCGRKGEMYE